MNRLEVILSQMSIDDKIGQLTQYNAGLLLNSTAEITGPQKKLGLSDEDLSRIGSVLNFSSPEEMIQIQDTHLKKGPNQIPLLFMMDVIHGYRTIYPIPLAMGCSFSPELNRECSRMAAKEASAGGVQVTFAPMVDYVRDPRWGRVLESCGEEPRLTGVLAQAQIQGFQGESLADKDSIATCVKHFAGYGGAEAGRDYNLAEISQRELREFYLPAFKSCIDAGVSMLMPSFNSLNGVPSTINPMLMQQILKDEWGFQGVVISDYNAIGELLTHGVAESERDAAYLAFQNGCDIEMCSAAYFHHLKEWIDEGIFTQGQLDQAVLRVLELKERLGLFDNPYHGTDAERAQRLFLCPEHREIARRAAEESAVLLKNDGILPFCQAVSKVAVIGPFAQEHDINGFWSCNGRSEDTVTVCDGIATLLGTEKVSSVPGCSALWDSIDRSGFKAAVDLAAQADIVVLCLGELQNYSGEGNCRTDLELPGLQTELARQVIQANPNTAVVLFNGRPLSLSTLDEIAPAILEMWFPGTEGGNAAARLLFGKANPCGKLSMTFPRSVGQCPIYYNHPNTGRPRWSSTINHKGYASDYIDCPTLPLYSFGHGLSYSHFVYRELAVSSRELTAGSSIQVRITVCNQGTQAGKEVVQLYMRDPVASVVRPLQQLIGFQKLAFSPGEEKTIDFTVSEEMLRFWTYEEGWISQPGTIILMTGYADHLSLAQTIHLIKEGCP